MEGIGTENMKVSYGLRIVVYLRSKNESRYPRTLYHYKKPCCAWEWKVGHKSLIFFFFLAENMCGKTLLLGMGQGDRAGGNRA